MMPGRLCRKENEVASGPITVGRLVSRSQFGFLLHQMSPTVGQPRLNPPHHVTRNAFFRHFHQQDFRLCHMPLSSQ